MDPKLSEEVKTLLGGVRAGVDDHVKDFRGQLTSEVRPLLPAFSPYFPFTTLLTRKPSTRRSSACSRRYAVLLPSLPSFPC